MKYVWDWNTPKKKMTKNQKTKLSTQSYVKCMIWHTTCYLLMFDDNTQEMCGIINKLYEEKTKKKNTHNENPKIKWKLKQFKNCCYAFFYGLFYNTMTRNEIKLEKNDTMKIKFQKNTKKKTQKISSTLLRVQWNNLNKLTECKTKMNDSCMSNHCMSTVAARAAPVASLSFSAA